MEEDLSKYKELFKDEAKEYLNRLNVLVMKLEDKSYDEKTVDEIFRIFHTLKGMAATVGYGKIEELSHDIEESLEEIKKSGRRVPEKLVDKIFEGMDEIEKALREEGEIEEKEENFYLQIMLDEDLTLPAAKASVIIEEVKDKYDIIDIQPPYDDIKKGRLRDNFKIKCRETEKLRKEIEEMSGVSGVRILKKDKSTRETGGKEVEGIRVSIEMLDYLQNIVGELVVTTSQLSNIFRDMGVEYREFFESHVSNIKDLQELVTRMRLVPLSLIFNKFPRYVRELSNRLDKKVSIDIEGADIEVDRSLLEGISDPLTHIIRNAVDHGIEPPEERKKLGKPETGHIKVLARREKGDILIEISDDGRGIDMQRVMETAMEKNLLDRKNVDNITEQEILQFLLTPGFSTREQVNEISGRGVGLDVVKKVLRSVGGNVDITTKKNKGTKILMKMPLSMAIIKVYLTESSGQVFALPMSFVEETLTIPGRFISSLLSREILLLRNEVLPVYYVSRIFKKFSGVELNSDDNLLSCVVVEVEGSRFALIVDRFIGSRDAVVKPLPQPLNEVEEFTGITIIGDGTPCLILDLPSLRYRRRYEDTGS